MITIDLQSLSQNWLNDKRNRIMQRKRKQIYAKLRRKYLAEREQQRQATKANASPTP